MSNTESTSHLRHAIALSAKAIEDDVGGPFGAVVVKDGQVVGEGRNRVLASHDPTAHAEVQAIRAAARNLGTHDLGGSVLYTSCEPCPMCLAAAYWARVERIVYAAGQEDAAAIGFDDAAFYAELERPYEDRSVPMQQMLREDAREAMDAWAARDDRQLY